MHRHALTPRPLALTATGRLVILLCAIVMGLAGCRGPEGDDEPEDPRFPRTADQDRFAQFLNAAPGVPRGGAAPDAIDNDLDFAEAYYRTIDPLGTRNSFDRWRVANGFLNSDLTEADCDPTNCRATRVRFRDAKDLGYGRDMRMRWNTSTGDVAVYVENFQVAGIPGVPYGPLNLEAVIEDDRQWNFGVNAIEFSSFPYTAATPKFAKFYNFAGDGAEAVGAPGTQQLFVDLDDRGDKSMPTPCIVCHGGQGRTLVVEGEDELVRLAPTITGGTPGDVQANLQLIELDTVEFADAPGFRAEDNEEGIRLVNEAILSTYQSRFNDFIEAGGENASGGWNPSLAIEIANGRYGGAPGASGAAFDADFVPSDWLANGQDSLYENLVGPNCMVCHALRGTGWNSTIGFAAVDDFRAYAERSHELVFEQGLMPLGLLNYSDLWDDDSVDSAALASFLGHTESIDASGRGIRPGNAVARIAAPLVATGIDSANGASLDIPVSGADSAFVAAGGYRWSVSPAAAASIAPTADPDDHPGHATLRVTTPGTYTLTLDVIGRENDGVADPSARDSLTIDVTGSADAGALPPASNIAFFGADGVKGRIIDNSCSACHAPNGSFPGIPMYLVACGTGTQGDDELAYRAALARANLDSPLASLILRKPSNGATDTRDRENTQISDYHAGGPRLATDEDYSLMLSWILAGAPAGPLPAGVDGAAVCAL